MSVVDQWVLIANDWREESVFFQQVNRFLLEDNLLYRDTEDRAGSYGCGFKRVDQHAKGDSPKAFASQVAILASNYGRELEILEAIEKALQTECLEFPEVLLLKEGDCESGFQIVKRWSR